MFLYGCLMIKIIKTIFVSGQLFYCNLITGDYQLKKPHRPVSLATDEEFSLGNEGPLRRPIRTKARHILIKHSLSVHTPHCRVLSGECATRSESDAYNLAKGFYSFLILCLKYKYRDNCNPLHIQGNVNLRFWFGSDLRNTISLTVVNRYVTSIRDIAFADFRYRVYEQA